MTYDDPTRPEDRLRRELDSPEPVVDRVVRRALASGAPEPRRRPFAWAFATVAALLLVVWVATVRFDREPSQVAAAGSVAVPTITNASGRPTIVWPAQTPGTGGSENRPTQVVKLSNTDGLLVLDVPQRGLVVLGGDS